MPSDVLEEDTKTEGALGQNMGGKKTEMDDTTKNTKWRWKNKGESRATQGRTDKNRI